MIILSILCILISNAVTLRRDMSILYSRVAIIVMCYCTMLAINSMDTCYFDNGIGLYGGLFCITTITQSFHIFIFVISGIILQLTAFYPRKIWHKNCSSLYTLTYNKDAYNNVNIIGKLNETFKIIEYPLIILFIVCGSLLLISSSDIVSVFLSIELQSYGLYLLSTIYRNSELSTSAGLTYFLLGGLSSCFILLGTSLLYVIYGTTNLDACYVITAISNVIQLDENVANYKALYINISLLIMSVGFLFKVSAAPFHFWSPDVYDAIPTVVTTSVSILAKISILVFILEMIHFSETNSYFSWKFALVLSSFVSLLIGTILGLTESRIKRLLAFSTISHLGFILMAISIGNLESSQAFIFYLMQYSMSNLNIFFILIAMGYYLYTYIYNGDLKHIYLTLSDRNNSPIQYISQIKGYYYINPLLALSLVITLFSFVGVPPLLGFFAKQAVLSVALYNGYTFLAIIGILTSVISAVYYLGLVKQIFFDSCDYAKNKSLTAVIKSSTITNKNTYSLENVTLSSFITVTISVLTMIILLFMFNANEWLNAAHIIALSITNP